MRVVLTGAGGQVGQALRAAAWPRGTTLIALDRRALDITDAPAVRTAFALWRPDAVINTAAYTDVDRAEQELDAAFAINRDGAGVLASACAACDAVLLQLSTDYVFDGHKPTAWQPDDPAAPLGAYGRSKAAGETAVRAALDRHVIVRTAWLHGIQGKNFVRTMLRAGEQKSHLKVVSDQVGGPTSADDLAQALIAIALQVTAAQGRFGTYHFCGVPYVSWYEFAEAIFARAEKTWGRRPHVAPITSEQWPTAAPRPKNSVLDCQTLARDYGVRQPDWRIGLDHLVARLLAAPTQ